MSKRKGPTRIPLFGSRIPISGQPTSEPVRGVAILSSKPVRTVTRNDIGRKVNVAEKEGALRYVGSVHFADGVWCGIEFPSACGKNNGCVQGVRYFACPESRGLMAPLSKVLILEEVDENEHNIVSGSHSMLFGVKPTQTPKKPYQNNLSFEEGEKRRREDDLPVNKVLIRSDTYNSLKESATDATTKRAFKRSGTYEVSETENNITNTSYTDNSYPTTCSKISNDSLSYLNENNFPDIVNSTIIAGAFDASSEIDATATVTDISSETFSKTLVNSLVENEHSRTPSIAIDSSTIVTPVPSIEKIGYNLNSNVKLQQFNESRSKESNSGIINELSSISFCKQIRHSTPYKAPSSDTDNSPRRRIRPTPTLLCSSIEDFSSKRDSLELEESLGILTPEQMIDGISIAVSRTPSSENIGSLPEDLQNLIAKFQYDRRSPFELPSPNLIDASTKDISLGLIDDRVLSNFTLFSDTTMNLELPLDSIGSLPDNYITTRLEQTPSPEDLPLDPAPMTELDCKTDPVKSKTTSSFINSITSITSLDTGYQGDGEMSRPGSRGPDHSPLTRRPLIRPQPRRPEPMTDSDFYTESDVDIPEEHPIRGDRRARVIDGTLYGVDAQTAADIYVNNRENMDSSGIFTDIESNTLSSADNENLDISPSPSDASSKTISNDSQNQLLKQNTPIKSDTKSVPASEANNFDLPSKRKSTASSATSSPASVRSPKHTTKEDGPTKKYKIPKRNVVSKVKAALESPNPSNNKETNRTPSQKPAGRWDAVMNKISKNQPVEKSNLKEVKSKVFSNISTASQPNIPQKIPSLRLRRPRPRGEISATTKASTIQSLNSSASDLSTASPAKKIGSTKKRADVVRVTQVLTAAQLSPRTPIKNNVLAENKKNAASTININDKLTPKKNPFVNREKKTLAPPLFAAKDCGRATVKGGRVSPGARPPLQNRAPVVHVPRTIEALTVLLQHLVFNLDAFQTPFLRKQLENNKRAAEKAELAYKELQESFDLFRIDRQKALDEEREKYQNHIGEALQRHQSELTELLEQQSKSVSSLVLERQQLEQSHKEQLVKLRTEFAKLQSTHQITLEILREENDVVREEIDEKNTLIKTLEIYKRESEKLEKEYQTKELKYNEQIETLTDEIERLKTDNLRMLGYAADSKEDKLQIVVAEVDSLRAVLELKQNEVSDLRKAVAQSNQKADLLPSATERVSLLTARCEDLESQLERKSLYESQLITDNRKLKQSLKDEFNTSKRLLQHNEELQWKLTQNKEVVCRVLEQAEETALSRSLATSSFNERHSSSPRHIERTSSFREQSLSNKSCTNLDNGNVFRRTKYSYDFDSEEMSPPTSPKVKGVVEKSESVSYVLDMEESPEIIANRIVRRSFRNPTPPKNTPIKSPVNKKPRIKMTPISVSASASSIIPALSKSNDHLYTRSLSVQSSDNEVTSCPSDEVFLWQVSSSSTPYQSYSYPKEKSTFLTVTSHNIDLEYDDDIKLPTLPSEIGRHDAESLPVPQHLAGDINVSESNSEDESITSSSSGHL